jgi:23S rRNA pseudouridine1911/1915/1917 synthase
VKQTNQRRHIYIVHRLDKDTSGLMVFAKDEKTKITLQDNWDEIVKERKYVGILSGELEKDNGTITSWLKDNKVFVTYSSTSDNGGDRAVTHYKTIKRANGYSLVEFELDTGRKNQIRVHAQDLKHPVIGDINYGDGNNPLGRLALHAFKLSFYHPVTGDLMKFETPYPEDFKKLMLKNKVMSQNIKSPLL